MHGSGAHTCSAVHIVVLFVGPELHESVVYGVWFGLSLMVVVCVPNPVKPGPWHGPRPVGRQFGGAKRFCSTVVVDWFERCARATKCVP